MQRIQLYYRNVLDEVIGSDHGLSWEQIDSYAQRIETIVGGINADADGGKLPYRKLPYDQDMLKQAQQAAEKYRAGAENLVVLGIGGSALGNIALQTALNHPFYNLLPKQKRPGPRLFVMDNVDPVQFSGLLELLDDQLDRTIFNVISKSGQTAETASQFLVVRRRLEEKLGAKKARDQLVVTTDPQSGTLRKIADEEGYFSLRVPPGVGGRFSVLSHVGLFSAAMCGIDTDALLAGARDMDQRVGNPALRDNPAAMMAVIQYLFYQRGKRISVMMPYSYQLKDLSDWFRQLWAESLGKNKTLDGQAAEIGPTPVKALGTTDQHSQVQLYREGPNDKLFTFLQVERFDAELPIPPQFEDVEALSYLGRGSFAKLLNSEKTATEYALVASNRPCLTVLFPRIRPETVGQFIYMFEMTTSIAGRLFNVNAYDQPAVELGKQATFALMGRKGYGELAEKLRAMTVMEPERLV